MKFLLYYDVRTGADVKRRNKHLSNIGSEYAAEDSILHEILAYDEGIAV